MNFQINRTKGEIISISFLAIFTGAIFYTVLNGTQSFFINFDNVEQFYPWYQKLNYAIHHHYLPLWDANTFGGKCFTGEFQTGIFYPVNIVWIYIFGTPEYISTYSLDLLVVFHFFIASLGMYLICRHWKLSYFSSILGGVIFAFTGCVMGRAAGQTAIFFGLTLTPYSFLFILKYYSSKKNLFLIYCGIFLGLQILAGHIQPFFHALILSFSYLMYKKISDTNDSIFTIGKNIMIDYSIIITATIITSLPQLYTGFKYLSQAYRWVSAPNPVGPGEKIPFETYSERFSITPIKIFNLIDRIDFPIDEGNDLFIGLIPVVISLLLFSFAKKGFIEPFDQNKKFFYWTMSISFIIMLGEYTFVPVILHILPMVSSVRQLSRYAILFHFSISILVAFGFQYFSSVSFYFTSFRRNLFILITSIGAIEILYLFIFQRNLLPGDIFIHLSILTILSGMILFIKNKNIVITVTFFCILFAIKYCSDYTVHSISLPSYPETFFKRNNIINYLETKYAECRVLIEDDAMPKNIGDVYKIQTKLGHGATMNKSYFDFIGQQWDRNSTINDILNVRYVVTKDTIIDLPLIMKDKESGTYLYERPTAYPRLFLKYQAENNRIDDMHLLSFRKIVYTDLYQKYEVNSSINDTLIFSENYYKGWKIFIDSKQTDILHPGIKHLNPQQMAVKIAAGKHCVELKYNPFY